MTLLLILMDHQSYMVHKTELPAESLAAQIGAGDWSDSTWQGHWINELPRQVIAMDGLVIVSVSRPEQTLPEDTPALPRVNFTRRQVEILDCLMQGLTPKEIGRQLSLSRRTLDEHLASIKLKLEARTIPQTVGKAVALGYWKSHGES
jgi:DNA-binding CsgD family transcriptional regulator